MKEKEFLRLDKYLGDLGFGTRKELKAFIKHGRVTVNGEVAKRPETKVSTIKDEVVFDEEKLIYKRNTYVIMNKPAGVISATSDPSGEETPVTDLLDTEYFYLDLAPVGRLDKDSVGLLLLTNDGIYSHQMTSPKKGIVKSYYILTADPREDDWDKKAVEGIVLEDEYVCKSARMMSVEDYEEIRNEKVQGKGLKGILGFNENYVSEICRKDLSEELKEKIENGEIFESIVQISEGKYHQVKRMIASLGSVVVYLKRISFGDIELPLELEEGKVIEYLR